MQLRSHGPDPEPTLTPPPEVQFQPQHDQLQPSADAPGGADVDTDGNEGETGGPVGENAGLWGYLQPCSNAVPRIDLFKEILRYSVGRDAENNYISLDGPKVSSMHCVLTWEPATSSVTVLDMSTNGTWLDGKKVGRGTTVPLTDGTEIGFGSAIEQLQDGGTKDFRYIFHYTANGPPTQGIKTYFDFGIQLGKGSSGTVSLATHRESGQSFAVKRIVKNASEGRDITDEVETMKRLEHPNICKLIQVFDADGQIFLVLEYVNGGDLLKLLSTQYPKGVPEIVAKDIIYQACDAMAFIHSKGIIHRDLKLENILLTTDPHPIVKIADFGLATALDGVTLLRRQCGTPAYIAPEMTTLREDEGYDHMVDSWSMGVITFSVLAGVLPFERKSNISIPEFIQTRTVDWDLLTGQYGLYPESIFFVHALLENNPAKRLSLSDSLGHPWLRDHVPYHVNIATVFKPTDTNRPLTAVAAYRLKLAKAMNAAAKANAMANNNNNMNHPRAGGISGMNSRQQVAHLLLNRSTHDSLGFDRNTASFFSQLKPTAFSPPPPAPALPGDGDSSSHLSSSSSVGRRSLVRRRSEIIAEAAEAGTPLPSPSQEMIANAERMSRAAKGKGRAIIEPALSTIVEAVEIEEADEDVHMESPEKQPRDPRLRPYQQRRVSPRKKTLVGRGSSRSVDRQQGPSRWAGRMRVVSGSGRDENDEQPHAEGDDDVEMGGSPVRRPGLGPSTRAMKRKGTGVASSRSVQARGPWVRQSSSEREKGAARRLGRARTGKGQGRK